MSPGPARLRGGGPHWTDANQDGLVLGLLIESSEEADQEFVSGAALCDKLDVPRAELLERIEALRARGYLIQASGGRGYRLAGYPDTIGEAQLAPLLAGEVGRRVHAYAELESTNDEAHRLADAGALHGEVVLAEVQTRGRGRRGRSWVAPPGQSLALSVILRPSLDPARAPELALTAAVALCEAARALGATQARIKWPNDIECGGEKLSGLLTELRAEPGRVRHVVLGIGLNVSSTKEDFPPELRGLATSLALQAGKPVPRVLACARLFEQLDLWLALHETEGFGAVLSRWRELSSTLGRRVTITGEGAPLEGVAEDVDGAGALLVRTGGEMVRVVAGDVDHCRVG